MSTRVQSRRASGMMCVERITAFSWASVCDAFADFHDLARVQAHRGLVENECRRIADESLGQSDPLPVTSRAKPNEPVRDRLQRAELENSL